MGEEFRGMLQVPAIKYYLSHLEIEVHDAEGLFDLLDDGDGQVTLSEFVSGVVDGRRERNSFSCLSTVRGIEQVDRLARLKVFSNADNNLQQPFLSLPPLSREATGRTFAAWEHAALVCASILCM